MLSEEGYTAAGEKLKLALAEAAKAVKLFAESITLPKRKVGKAAPWWRTFEKRQRRR